MIKPKYIHYGHSKFDKEKFKPISNREFFSKPYGGLWASNMESKHGWKQWCEDNDFRECNENNSFCFVLKDNANVIHLYREDDMKNLPKVVNDQFPEISKQCLDFEKMLAEGVDAIELHLSEGSYDLYFPLYGWDCDSLLVLNKDVIEEKNSEQEKNKETGTEIV